MIDKDRIVNTLEYLAARAKHSDEQGASRLLSLKDAVGSQAYAQAWADSDIYQMIAPDLIMDRYREQDTLGVGCLVGGLELARNSLIFAPIFVTWLSVSQASSKYQELLNACLKSCPDQVAQPFLYLWEQGFGGRLPGVLRLSTIGLIDASILFVVFMLTWIVSLLANTRNSAQERRVQEFHSSLVNVIADASLYLRNRPPPLVSSSDNLDDVAKQIEYLANQTLNRFGDVADEIGDKFDSLTKRMEARFADATREYESVAKDLSAQFSSIEKELTRQLQKSNEHIDAMGRLAGGVTKISTEINVAADALERVNKDLNSNLSLLIGPVKDLAKQQQDLLDAANGAVAHLESTVKKINEMGERQEKWSDQFLDTVQTLETSINKVAGVVGTIDKLNKQQQDFLTELHTKGESLSTVASRMNEAILTMQDFLDGMQGDAVHIRSIANDLEDIRRFTATLSNNNHMQQIIEDYSEAAGVIEQSAEKLSDCADMLFSVLKSLKSSIK